MIIETMGINEVMKRVVRKSTQIDRHEGDCKTRTKDEGESTKRSWSHVEETQE